MAGELIADQIEGSPCSLENTLADALAPARFLDRPKRRTTKL
jgi:hypothetical protein